MAIFVTLEPDLGPLRVFEGSAALGSISKARAEKTPVSQPIDFFPHVTERHGLVSCFSEARGNEYSQYPACLSRSLQSTIVNSQPKSQGSYLMEKMIKRMSKLRSLTLPVLMASALAIP